MPRSSLLTRRRLILGSAFVSVAGAGAWMTYARDRYTGDEMTPDEAHAKARSGEVTLIDIRRPDEWARTGVGEGAHPIDMRKKDAFYAKLDAILGGDKTRPVALICAGGVRSDWLSAELILHGYTNVIDIPEGMMGSKAGPGWVRRQLPVTK